ncbi:MAG TPA: hypothetical protein VML75_03165 [Kofleriaceae bacterium]|nr:hypothetical protein [Kofleriaceae bacterium]
MGRLVFIVLIASATAACGDTIAPTDTFNLDRPSSVAFGCWGDMRVTNGAEPTRQQDVISSAQPVASCQARQNGTAAAGQEELDDDGSDDQRPNPQAATYTGFVLQPSKGSVAVVQYSTDPTLQRSATIIDADPFTPGRNSIGIGTLPVGLATSTDGCYAISANGGSCDMSALDIGSALDRSRPAQVTRVQLYDGNGERLLAKPMALVAEPPSTAVGFECPATPQGIMYVAYPDCNWVAAIDLATGVAVAGIQFGDGTVTVTDGAVTCADACGSGAVTVAEHRDIVGGPGRPVALHMAEDGGRLYIGADNVAAVTVVQLDAARLPTGVFQVPLYGDVGVVKLAASPVIPMGGTTGSIDTGSGGPFQFVYAIATDATVRVVDVHNLRAECDTQVDPRYLHDVRDLAFLACMPVGDVRTPPRRQQARSPGIHLPKVRGGEVRDWEDIPLDVAITPIRGSTNVAGAEVGPVAMIGYYAFITASEGVTFVANIDDDKYPDFEDAADPAKVYMPLAIAHQLRDLGLSRTLIDEVNDTRCAPYTADPVQLGPRVTNTPVAVFDPGFIAQEKLQLLASVRGEICDPEDRRILTSELSYTASVETREQTYPDLMSLQNELIRVTWEGLVSLDGSDVNIDGPPVRSGIAESAGGVLSLVDTSAPFCRMGVEPYDIGLMAGCDPSRGNAQCGVGEKCYVHPEAPSSLGSGTCVPAERESQLSSACRDYMVSRRRYSIVTTDADRVTLMPRRRVLDTSPVDGCASADQCQEYYQLERSLASPEHPVAVEPVDEEFVWACEADPSRAPGPDVCVMSCQATTDCEASYFCDAGRCVEAPIPPAACVAPVQRYQVRVGGAYAVLGENSGFLHDRVVDPATGECMDDPVGNPLALGRIPLRPPACVGDGFGDVSPNPCSTTVSHSDEYQPYVFEQGQCVVPRDGDNPIGPQLRTRDLPAVRVTLPGVRFHLVNLTTSGDESCRGDAMSTRPPFSLGHSGLQVRFELTGGFVPMLISSPSMVFPSTIQPAPDGSLWILDEADLSVSTQGRVVRIFPEQAPEGFSPVAISTGN